MADNATALASACRRRPQLLHTVTFSPFAFSPSLPEPELLKSLSSAINVVHAGPRAAARALVPVDEALPLLLHASPAVRIKAAKLVAKLLGIPDELRARLTERSAAPFAAEPEQQQQQLLRPLGPPDSSAGIFQSSGLRGLDDERHPDLDADAADDDIDTDTAIMDASLSPEALGDELSLCTEAGVRWAASSASLAAASGGASGGLPPPRSSFVSLPHAEAALGEGRHADALAGWWASSLVGWALATPSSSSTWTSRSTLRSSWARTCAPRELASLPGSRAWCRKRWRTGAGCCSKTSTGRPLR